MSTFDLEAAVERARVRLAVAPAKRRADAGRSRLPTTLQRRLEALLRTHERPHMRDVQRVLRAWCTQHRITMPSRATLYNAVERCRPPRHTVASLPEAVRASLYNVDPSAELDGAQVAFYAFNYGDLRATTWAAGTDWLALHHAARMRGWRPKSLGLLRAVMAYRGIA